MNTQKQIILIMAFLFVLGGGCAAYTAIDLTVRAPDQQEYQYDGSVERGALLFANNCRSCHGNRGEGGVGLPLNTEEYKNQDPLVLAANKAKLRRTLYCGRAGTLMQPWLNTNGGSLNAVQIEHLITLITDPIEEGLLGPDGQPTSVAWHDAERFAENLNHGLTGIIGGDTLSTIAKVHSIGVREIQAVNPRFKPNDPIPAGTRIMIPASKGFPDGRSYVTTQDTETLAKIADAQSVGAAAIADLNNLNYKIDGKRGTIHLLDDQGREQPGLYPGQTLRLPEGATYRVSAGDTLDSIATKHGLSVSAVRSSGTGLGSRAADQPFEFGLTDAPLILNLPRVDRYQVQGQTLKDVVAQFANVSEDSFRKENSLPANAILPIGTVLKLPKDSWGSAPAGAPNPGTACVEYAVPNSVWKTLPGIGTPEPAPTKPAMASTTVKIVGNANDWTVTADGAAQPANKGAVLIKAGTTVKYEVAAGLHNIVENGTVNGADVKQGDTRDIVYSKPGEYKITCGYHPDMKAWIWVE